MVAGRVDALDGELGVGVNAAALDRRAVVALLLGDNVLGALQGLQVGVEEASLLADGLVASDHFEVLLKHFRLTFGFSWLISKKSKIFFVHSTTSQAKHSWI